MKYKCWCKATNREGKEPRYSPNWVAAKRAWFKIYEDHIECGSWNIKIADIESAHLYRARQMFIPVTILKLTTSSGTYQFGFNPWAKPLNYVDIEYSEENVRLGYSLYSIIVRVILCGYLGYLVWKWWLKT